MVIQIDRASQVILESLNRTNQRFVAQALLQWDIDGQGCFATYVQRYVEGCWGVMTAWN